MHETGCSELVHWDDPGGMGWERRWEGVSGWGTHVHPWLIHVNVWQKPLQYCKVISLQLKYINFKNFLLLISSYIIVIKKNTWYNFNFLKFVNTSYCVLVKYGECFGKCPTCYWPVCLYLSICYILMPWVIQISVFSLNFCLVVYPLLKAGYWSPLKFQYCCLLSSLQFC